MNFEQIDCFLAAARCSTFFDAAETLHTTQSSLSKQIQKLERELDLVLFDRSHRKAVLTPAGEMFFEEALILSRTYHQALFRIRKYQTELGQKLCIGTLPILTQYHLTGRLKAFQEKYPTINLTISEVEEPDLIDGLSRERYDLIIGRSFLLKSRESASPNPQDSSSLAALSSREYVFLSLASDRLSVLLPSSHPLAGKAAVSLSEIAHERFLMMNPYTSIYRLCEELFQNANIHPQILRTARVESIISAVAFEEGISLLPEGNLQLFQHEQVTAVPLADSPPLDIGIIYRKNAPLSLPMQCLLREFSDSN
ncbi:MAG: LysR family transcriptional regulator [Fusicatenibacter sp.]|nr:LysR family transcriptional regulator [Fusicatenibacter sp.]